MSRETNKNLSDEAHERMDIMDAKIFYKVLEQKFQQLNLRFDEVHERLDKVESSAQKGQPPIAPNVQRRETNQPRFVYEDDYGDDLDEDDRASNASLGRFGSGHGNRGD